MKPGPLFYRLGVKGLSAQGLKALRDLEKAYGSFQAARAAVHEHGSYRAALEAAPKR